MKKYMTGVTGKKLGVVAIILMIIGFLGILQKQNQTHFLPKGYSVSEKIYGDINNDGLEDVILMVKGNNKNNIIIDRNLHALDRNRRGIIVLLNKNGYYEQVLENYDCFSSENEDGGVYFPPDISIDVKNTNLSIHYAHGRYGYWEYVFTYKDRDFELITYQGSSNHGPMVQKEIHINFITKEKKERVNTNQNAETGDEIFIETIQQIRKDTPIKLSEVKSFDTFDQEIINLTYIQAISFDKIGVGI